MRKQQLDRRLFLGGIVAAGGTLVLERRAFARSAIFSDKAGAIRGYDPVAYFKQNKPVRGDGANTTTWMGAKWSFVSAANLSAFKKNPTKYAPQFGGYCAYAMSQGRFATIDPNAFTIVSGKLYLNYSKSIEAKWLKDRDNYIKAANKNWLKLKP